MADVLDLQQLLKVETVPVVQCLSFDLGGLANLLKQLLQGQKDSNDQLQRQQADLDALKAAQADQAQREVAAAGGGTEPEADATAAPDRLQEQLAALGDRLSDLEARLPALSAIDPAASAQGMGRRTDQEPAGAAASSQEGATPGTDIDSAANAAVPDAASTGRAGTAGALPPAGQADLVPADLVSLKDQQQQLAKQLADIAAAHRGLQQQVAGLQDSKADRADVRDMLADGLRSKADGAAVAQLKALLADKADTSELDALLNAMSSSSGADISSGDGPSNQQGPDNALSGAADSAGQLHGDGASSADTTGGRSSQHAAAPGSLVGAGSTAAAPGGGVVGGSRRGTRDPEAAGDTAQQLSRLQLQLALLQDRADGHAVAELSDGLASTDSQLADLSAALQDLQQQLVSAQKGLGHLQDSLNSHAGDAMKHAGRGQPSTAPMPGAQDVLPAGGQSSSQDGGWDPTAQQQQQLGELTAKVAGLEAALTGLQAAVAEAAAAASTQPPQQQRRVSGEQPASSRLVQALAAQLADLGSKVSRLAAAGAAGPSTGAGGNGSDGITSAQPAAPDAAGLAAGGDAAGHAAAGFNGDGAAGPGFSAELAAELDGRLSDLEALVQELSDTKADQAGVLELRALLADTATQADTEQLRQRLASQQSLLDRLARQVSDISSSHSADHGHSSGGGRGAGGSRPTSAAGGAAHHGSSPAASSPENSFFGGAAGGAAGAGAGVDPHLGGVSLSAQGQGGGQWFDAADRDAVGSSGLSGDQLEGVVQGLQAQLQAHQDSLEQLAEAVSLLATGQAAPAAAAAAAAAGGGGGGGAGRAAGVRGGALGSLQVDSDGLDLAAGRSEGAWDGELLPETPNLRFAKGQGAAGTAAAAGGAGFGGTAAAAASGRPGTAMDRASFGSRLGQHVSPAAAPAAAAAAAAAAIGAGPGPQVARLKRLLQTGQFGRKMDWFDPTLLQKMAQRLAAIDALLRNGAGGSASAAGGAASGDLEGKLRRLATDVRQLRDRLAELTAPGSQLTAAQGGLRGLGQVLDGDHSMLSGKPLGGYRCMACDRPLTALDSRPGPHLPLGQLPVSLVSGAELAAGAGRRLASCLPPAAAAVAAQESCHPTHQQQQEEQEVGPTHTPLQTPT